IGDLLPLTPQPDAAGLRAPLARPSTADALSRASNLIHAGVAMLPLQPAGARALGQQAMEIVRPLERGDVLRRASALVATADALARARTAEPGASASGEGISLVDLAR